MYEITQDDLRLVRTALCRRRRVKGYLIIEHGLPKNRERGQSNRLEQRWPDELEEVIRRRQRLAS